jgi:hypothetical protein
MLIKTLLLATCLLGQTKIEPAHAENPVFTQVLERGLDLGGQSVKLPPPLFFDGQTADAERAALREVAGSDRAVDDMLRDSVTAPFIIRVRDVKVAGATIRAADIWFAVHGELEQTDLLREAGRVDQKEVEVANMWFQTRMLRADELTAAGITPPKPAAGQNVWEVHVHAKLLDRIDFEVTNHVVATQSADSIVIASQTDPSYDNAGPFANCWKSLKTGEGSPADPAAKNPYSGGMSYAKMGRLSLKPGTLLVEMHAAFVEPDPWFQGAPILRSKFSVAAQDQIRTLRREMTKKRAK